MKNCTLLNQELKTLSFEKDSRFFFVLKDLQKMEWSALQALHLLKINQLEE